MDIKSICDSITRLYLYAVSTKFIHYSCFPSHLHELCDTAKETIEEFTDKLAESYFGYEGKPKFSNFSIGLEINTEDDLRDLCDRCIGIVEPIRKECEKNEKLSGIVSLIDDFLSELGKIKFLCTFDKLSSK